MGANRCGTVFHLRGRGRASRELLVPDIPRLDQFSYVAKGALYVQCSSCTYLKVDSSLVVDAEADERLVFAVGGVVIVVVGGVRAQVAVLLPVERLRKERR